MDQLYSNSDRQWPNREIWGTTRPTQSNWLKYLPLMNRTFLPNIATHPITLYNILWNYLWHVNVNEMWHNISPQFNINYITGNGQYVSIGTAWHVNKSNLWWIVMLKQTYGLGYCIWIYALRQPTTTTTKCHKLLTTSVSV